MINISIFLPLRLSPDVDDIRHTHLPRSFIETIFSTEVRARLHYEFLLRCLCSYIVLSACINNSSREQGCSGS